MARSVVTAVSRRSPIAKSAGHAVGRKIRRFTQIVADVSVRICVDLRKSADDFRDSSTPGVVTAIVYRQIER